MKVLIDIASPSEQWRALGDGFRVGVRIVTLAVDNALMVPVSAVFPLPAPERGNHGDMAAFTPAGGRARFTPVQVGVRNGADAWVQKGLQPGTSVIVYPPSAVKDGTRVKARKV